MKAKADSRSNWIKLVLGLLLCYLFIFVFTPYMTNQLFSKQYKPIIEADLDCTPLLYTESEEGMEAIYRLSFHE